MLNSIKDMIKQKKLFQEAAELLLEDEQLDDSILLNEEPVIPETFTEDDDEPSLPEVDDEEHDEDEPEKEDKEDDDSEKGSDDDDDDDKDDDKDDDGEKPEEKSDESDEDDIMNAPMGDDLPEPVSAATQEPISSDDTANILSMEIDLATNTPTDVLPTPPASAVDALDGEDDILSQRVDSGFGGESTEEPAPAEEIGESGQPNLSKDEKEKLNSKIVKLMNDPDTKKVKWSDVDKGEDSSDASKNESFDILDAEDDGEALSEAITIGGSDDSSSDAPDADMGSGTPKDNTVTSAVKDKLNEINSDDQPAEEPELFPDDDSSTGDNSSDGAPVDKAELLKKLSKLTNGIEDAKMAVMKAIK